LNDYIEILEEEINRLNNAMKCLDSINVIDYNNITIKKSMQKRINKGYSLIIDVKMDLEKIVDKMGEENE
jgi:hypothetical protein